MFKSITRENGSSNDMRIVALCAASAIFISPTAVPSAHAFTATRSAERRPSTNFKTVTDECREDSEALEQLFRSLTGEGKSLGQNAVDVNGILPDPRNFGDGNGNGPYYTPSPEDEIDWDFIAEPPARNVVKRIKAKGKVVRRTEVPILADELLED